MGILYFFVYCVHILLFILTGMHFGPLLMCVLWLVFLRPTSFPCPSSLFSQKYFSGALSTRQGTDHPHVCPPLGGPATQSAQQGQPTLLLSTASPQQDLATQ
jgi:hypothetical protein